MSVNKVILIGRVGKDPEVRHLDGGNTVVTLSLATSEKYTDKQGVKKELTEWHNLVVWGKLGEVFEKHVTKGQEIYVEGKLKTDTYDNKEGVKMYSTKVVVQNFSFLGSKKEGEKGDSNQVQESTSNIPTSTDVPTDDLPF